MFIKTHPSRLVGFFDLSQTTRPLSSDSNLWFAVFQIVYLAIARNTRSKTNLRPLVSYAQSFISTRLVFGWSTRFWKIENHCFQLRLVDLSRHSYIHMRTTQMEPCTYAYIDVGVQIRACKRIGCHERCRKRYQNAAINCC